MLEVHPLMRPRSPEADAGFTMIEILVSSVLFSFVSMIFAFGMMQMYRVAGQSEALILAQNQLHVAFERLDVEVRHSSAIAVPAVVGGAWYVELLTTQTGTAVCTQLRLANSLLQRRSWTASQVPATNSWQTFASGITAVGQPFSVVAAGQDGHQRLVVNVTASAGGVRDTQSRKAAVSFTSLNSTVNGAAPDQCSQHRLVA